ncbi:MAG: flagellar biosynthesis regulator FlaF [Alsobacter sp.]
MANLAIFIFNHTMKTMIEPSPDRLRSLVSINRELAAGLRARPPAG